VSKPTQVLDVRLARATSGADSASERPSLLCGLKQRLVSRAWLGWCAGGMLLVAGVLGVDVDPVFAAEAPMVEGVSSGEETATTAVLQGQVNPEESSTSCVFEYGTSR
jgi:hypothetical protein